MKRLFTLLAAVSLTATAFAQIPNPSFETWTTNVSGASSHHDATSWGDLNNTTGSLSTTYTCDSGTVGAPDGSAYVKLTTKSITIPLSPTPIIVPGVVVTGTINVNVATMAYNFTGGFANSTRPASLTGKMQHMPSGADHGRFYTILTKWNTATSSRDTVALSDTTLTGMAMSWTAFTFPLTYKKGFFPDSAFILLSSSAATPVAGSYLYADNLAFFGTVAGVVPVSNATSAAFVYPNPASGLVTVYYQSHTGTDIGLHLCDLTGKTVRSLTVNTVRGENNILVDIKGLSQGIYILKIVDESGTTEKKLMVE
jgi:hypothetical protein